MPLTNVKLLPGFDKTDTPQVLREDGLMVILLDLDIHNQKKLVVLLPLVVKPLQVRHVLNIRGLIFKVESMQL